MTIAKEISRKCFHLLLLIIPFTYYRLGKWPSLEIFSVVTAIVVSIDYLRRKSPKIQNIFIKIFSPILREHELKGDKLCGASFVGLAACITFALFKSPIAITAFVILAISDTAASMIGKTFPSQPFFEKSFLGSAAFLVTGFVVLLSCGSFFDVKIWFYLFGFFALLCTTLIEARPSLFKLDDNFTIPVSFSTIMAFFDIIWNYSY